MSLEAKAPWVIGVAAGTKEGGGNDFDVELLVVLLAFRLAFPHLLGRRLQ